MPLMPGKGLFGAPLSYREMKGLPPPLEDLIGLLLQKLKDTKKKAAMLKPDQRQFFNDDLNHSERRSIFAIIENCKILDETLTRLEGVFAAKGAEYKRIIDRLASLERSRKERAGKDLSLKGIDARIAKEFKEAEVE